MKYAEQVRVIAKNGDEQVRCMVTRPIDSDRQRDLRHAVVATGWCGGNGSLRGLACGIVEAAVQMGRRDLAVVTYDDCKGVDAYDQDSKTARFAAVARAFSAERPAIAVGHSRGWHSVAAAGASLARDEHIDMAVGLTPAGLSSRGTARGVRDLAAELISGGGRSMRASKQLGAMACLVENATPHIVAHPVRAAREIAAILTSRAHEETVALSGLVKTGIIFSAYDRVGRVEAAELCDDGYEGTFASINASHSGIITVERHAANVYRSMLEIERQETALPSLDY